MTRIVAGLARVQILRLTRVAKNPEVLRLQLRSNPSRLSRFEQDWALAAFFRNPSHEQILGRQIVIGNLDQMLMMRKENNLGSTGKFGQYF